MSSFYKFAFQSMENDDYEISEIKLFWLNMLLNQDKMIKSQVEEFIFSQFEKVQNTSIKKLILENIFMLEKSSIKENHIYIDVQSMLVHECFKIREMAILLVEHFFDFYKFDEFLMFKLRKNKRIRGYMYENEVYKNSFKIKYKHRINKNLEEKTIKINLSDLLLKNYKSLCKCDNFSSFKAICKILKDEKPDFYLNMSIEIFLQKIKMYELKNSPLISQLQLEWLLKKEEGVDLSCLIDLHNLEKNEDFLFLERTDRKSVV